MNGAALARAAKGWQADARAKALGADLKNDAIVYVSLDVVSVYCFSLRLQLT